MKKNDDNWKYVLIVIAAFWAVSAFLLSVCIVIADAFLN